MTFKKGESGNPQGRKREDGDLRALARTFTREAVDRLVYWMRSDDTRASVASCGILLDRGWGKPAQEVELSGKDGVTIPVINVTVGAIGGTEAE